MSISLAVKLTCPVNLESVLSGTEKALQEILRLSQRPSVQPEAYSTAVTPLMPSDVIAPELGMVRITIRNHDDDPVFLFASRRSGGLGSGKEGGTFGIVEVHGDGAGLALAAAVALALARDCGAEIEDNTTYFTPNFEQPHDEFLEFIRLDNVRDDLQSALGDFRESLQ